MRIGFSIFLMAVGAVLTFAVHKTATGVNIHTVGIILMITGALGLVVTMTIFTPRRRVAGVVTEHSVTTAPVASPTVVTAVPPVVTTQQVVENRDTY